jgi:hypothetical protein
MKTISIAFAGLLLTGALAALCAGLAMVHAAPGLSLVAVAHDVAGTGALAFSGGVLLAALLAGGLGMAVSSRVAGWIAFAVLALAGLTAIGWAAFQAGRLFRRIQTVTEHVGGLDFAIRAPGYADGWMILAAGLAAGGLAFAALAWLLRVRKT